MASRWLAIISACQTSPTAITLIATTQMAIIKLFCVSETGASNRREIHSMVAGLLVLGRYAVGPTRDFAGECNTSAQIVGQVGGQFNRYAHRAIAFENQWLASCH